MAKNRGFKLLLLLNAEGKKQTLEFSTEDELVQFLKESHRTAAPLAFQYDDGSPLESAVLNRIYQRVFAP